VRLLHRWSSAALILMNACSIAHDTSNRDGVGQSQSAATSGYAAWTIKIGGLDRAIGARAVEATPKGSVVAVGYFRGAIDLGTGEGPQRIGATTPDDLDIWVVKYDAYGKILWSKIAGGDGQDDDVADVAVDTAGNIYLAVMGKGADLGCGATTGASITKLAPGGGCIWSRIVPTSTPVLLTRTIAVDVEERITVSLLYGSGGVGVAQLGATGDMRWEHAFKGDISDPGLGVDGMGSITIAAEMSGTVEVGGGPIASPTGHGILVGRFDSEGVLLWQDVYAADLVGGSTKVDVAPTGEFAVAGIFGGTLRLRDFTVEAFGMDAFVAKFGADGAPMWVRHPFGTAIPGVANVAIDEGGFVDLAIVPQVAADASSATFAIGTSKWTLIDHATVVARFSPTKGYTRWVRKYDGVYADDLSVTPNRRLLVVGSFANSVDFGDGPIFVGPDDHGAIFVTRIFN
jgi:hypothetical protein